MAEKLGPRQAAILRAIVREFVRSGEPIGSKHLVDRSRLDVSPATVRNEMARLEELGYLTQPHTSAGRIPTDAGYRFVVDELKPRALAEGQQRALAESLGGDEPASVEDLLRRATEVVSRFTRHASAVLAQRARSSALRRLEVIPVGSRAATVIAIAENGRVEQRMIHADHEMDRAAIDTLCEGLNREHAGKDLEDVIASLDALDGAEHDESVLEGVVDAIRGLAAGAEHVFVGGVANLASESDFERDTLQRLYEELDRQTSVLEILASALDDPVTVRIGSELRSEPFQNCSIVIARFGGGGEASGSVSVIGPMRMDYERVIATANGVARLLENSLGPQDQ